jgi:hypothetical protein
MLPPFTSVLCWWRGIRVLKDWPHICILSPTFVHSGGFKNIFWRGVNSNQIRAFTQWTSFVLTFDYSHISKETNIVFAVHVTVVYDRHQLNNANKIKMWGFIVFKFQIEPNLILKSYIKHGQL